MVCRLLLSHRCSLAWLWNVRRRRQRVATHTLLIQVRVRGGAIKRAPLSCFPSQLLLCSATRQRRRDIRLGLTQSRTRVHHTQQRGGKKPLIILLKLDSACGGSAGGAGGWGAAAGTFDARLNCSPHDLISSASSGSSSRAALPVPPTPHPAATPPTPPTFILSRFSLCKNGLLCPRRDEGPTQLSSPGEDRNTQITPDHRSTCAALISPLGPNRSC